MVRERIGDWPLAWPFAPAGVLAGLLVLTPAKTGLTNGTFDVGQDQLLPAPAPDSHISSVEIDTRSQKDIGAHPFNNVVFA
jgi:CHASE2 domain-containing sensor protein